MSPANDIIVQPENKIMVVERSTELGQGVYRLDAYSHKQFDREQGS